MTYEQRMEFLANCKPEKRDEALLRILRGEKDVDITKDEDLFFQVNKDRVSLDQYTNRDKFKASAEDMKKMKQNIDPNHRSPGSHMKLIGEMPPEIYFNRPEFAAMNPDRAKNIKKWLNEYHAFRIGDKKL